MVLTPVANAAELIGLSGGVYNEYEYEEVVFVTGEPIKFMGEMKVSTRDRDDEKKISYDFDLQPVDSSIEGELSRKITLEIKYDKRTDKGQEIANAELTKYREDIEIEGDEYELEDFQLSKSDVIDKRAASDFFSGNIKGRKYYRLNDEQGKVIVDITGGNVGYENFWGDTETQIMDYSITYTDADDSDMSWQGNVRAQVSDSLTKKIRYSDNQANLSSFNGGYIRTTEREIVSKYDYNLPEFNRGEPDDKDREVDDIELSRKMVPKVERLIVPKFKDLGGHWAQSYIGQLYSLDIMEEVSQFFSPDIPMTRVEFTKAVMNACNIRPSLEEENSSRRRRTSRRDEEDSPFIDMTTDDENYKYVKEAYDKGIIVGENVFKFEPKKALTKAQAVTMLIRALGFDSKAPTPGYYTSFSDDSRIPNWAKDSIYVAREIGLITGDSNNKIWPDKEMTRAEASAMLVRFLKFLERDLQKDYRENIILY